MSAFRAWLGHQQYSPITVSTYGRYAERAEGYLAGEGVTLETARSADLRAFLASIAESSASQRQARKALAAYYAWAIEGEVLDVDPSAALRRIPEPHRLPRPIPEEAFLALIAAAHRVGGQAETLVLLFAWTGCRFSEARRARVGDFDFGVQATWRARGKASRRKGPQPRQIPIRAELAVVVAAAGRGRDRSEYLFAGPTGELRSESWIRDLFKSVCADAGLEGVVPHRIRHTVATLIVDRDRDLRAAQELLGHASVATTQIYTKVAPTRLRSIVEGLPAA